jgi:Tol biopolymer transport system component/DNA-binding winged helix-turn-helix (wHTH) protein
LKDSGRSGALPVLISSVRIVSLGERSRDTFRFGVFQFSRLTGRLLRNGIPVKLPPQPTQVLLLLVERAGEVVTREEIQQLTWSDNTTVDFEVGINRCIRRIRAALIDDADAPRYLETVPRVGYRFIAPVESVATELEPEDEVAVSIPADAPAPEPPSEPRGLNRGLVVLIAVAAIAAAVGVAVYWSTRDRLKEPKELHAVPLALGLGDQFTPTFSPDGRQVAFAWNGEAQDNFDIYVKLVNSSTAELRLTTSKDVDYSPAWSPDGKWIAFCRGSEAGTGGIWIVPALGGAEREIIHMDVAASPWNRMLSWTPDSQQLIVSMPIGPGSRLALHAIDVNTGSSRVVTHPAGSDEDMYPAVSPDGESVAFTRDVGRGISRVMIAPWAGGAPEPVFAPSKNGYNARSAWTPDGRQIVLVSNAMGESHAWLAPVKSKQSAIELQALGEDIYDVAVSATGQLGLVRQEEDSNLYVLTLKSNSQEVMGLPKRMVASTRMEDNPSIRPDGQEVAFASTRSGFAEIWTARLDGSDVMQVTDLKNPVTGSPDWAPDGCRIAFDSRASGSAELYLTSCNGGTAKTICCNDRNVDTVPRWAPDGRNIYFSSDRTGRKEIWRVSDEGGVPVQITKEGGFAAIPSLDGKSIYYTTDNAPISPLWKQDLVNGNRKLIAPSVLRRSFAPAKNGVYFFTGSINEGRSSLFWIDDASLHRKQLFTTDRHVGTGLALAPDGRTLWYPQMDISGHHLFFVQNFWK